MTLEMLVHRVATQLNKKNQTLGLAESCTGGLIASSITSRSGASKYFYGGLVCYANHTKHDLLGVPNAVLKKFGAVSPETAVLMARGTKKNLKVDWAVSVTGIAGPSGGTPAKPVGLVFMSVVGPRVEVVEKRMLKGTREQIQRRTAIEALGLLSQLLKSR